MDERILLVGCSEEDSMYPHFEKSKIEKLVKEMIQSCVIISNTSSFSSPVLLVKKRIAHGDFMSIIEPLIKKLLLITLLYQLWMTY